MGILWQAGQPKLTNDHQSKIQDVLLYMYPDIVAGTSAQFINIIVRKGIHMSPGEALFHFNVQFQNPDRSTTLEDHIYVDVHPYVWPDERGNPVYDAKWFLYQPDAGPQEQPQFYQQE